MTRSQKNIFVLATIVSSLSLSGVVLADGGGGGAGTVGDLPSRSGPQYDPAVEYKNGLDALNAKDFKGAERYFNHVLRVVPKDANALFMLGVAREGQNSFRSARDSFLDALKSDPKHIGAHRELAIVYIKLKDTANANKELDGLKARATECGETCADASDLKAAISAVDAASAPGSSSSIAPPSLLFGDANDADRAYVAAVVDINRHRYDEALASLKSAESAIGPHPDVLTYIGYTYRKLGQYDMAETYYQRALAVAPEHKGATEYYGELKVERGDMAGAKKMLARLDDLCAFGCVEAEDLRRWIAQGHE